MYINNNVRDIQIYNPTKLTNPESLESFVRINMPFRCDCFDGMFLGHVFNYNLRTGDTYETISQERYANLTIEDWIQSLILMIMIDYLILDSGLFLTYPLRPGETLESISSAANLSSVLIRSYNSGVVFSQGSGLIYIPG
ncbi:putative non-specific serine/threonine protein kinase [Helianthus anomalus]